MTELNPIPLTCANHPNRETSLRCSRCEKPICPQCAVQTPTGYRCKECVKVQQKVFDTATWIDYPLAFFVAAILSYLGSLLAQFVGFFILIIAPFVGVVIAEGVRFATRKHRARSLYNTALAGTIAGCLPNILIPIFISILGVLSGDGYYSLAGGLSILWDVIYAALAASSMYYRLSGIQIGRK